MSEESKNSNGAVASILETLKTNPKAMYAAIGAGLLLILGVLSLSGGGSSTQAKIPTIGPGQSVVLGNPNGGDSHLTAVPGMQSASEAEENQEVSICVAPEGTRATVQEEQLVGLLPYVKLNIIDGVCQGKSGWTSKVNIKAG
ncbi:MAG: hypothetical protein ACR2HF_06980 [Methylococcaceae bacterium]